MAMRTTLLLSVFGLALALAAGCDSTTTVVGAGGAGGSGSGAGASGGAGVGGSTTTTTGVGGAGGSTGSTGGGLPAVPECASAEECDLLNDCCSCAGVPAGTSVPCDVPECFAPTCSVHEGTEPLQATCAAGRCDHRVLQSRPGQLREPPAAVWPGSAADGGR